MAPPPMIHAGTVLVVDDLTDLRTMLAVRLEDEGYVVVEASSVREALAAVRAHLPDVVLLDIVLPDVDGLVVLDRIHREDPTIPVIMITGLADEARAQSALRLGATDYLCKPIDFDQLDKVILRALTGRRDACLGSTGGGGGDDGG